MGSKLEDQVNLYARHEALLLSHGGAQQHTTLPAAIITGFLGAGKTTLIDHILRSRGELRIAVLVNEVGSVDVDSQLVNTRTANAALGLPAADLSGGCLCCTALGGLTDALTAIRAATYSGTSAPLDYLLVETSGVADAEPLAAALASHGCRLECVVAVVDAEAGAAALQQEVAAAQVRCADVVVVNKCDVAGLGAAADVEDEVQRVSPGVRMLRARFGRIPLPTILDVAPVQAPGSTSDMSTSQSDSQAAGASKPGIHGEVPFLSHEACMTSTHVPAQAGFRTAGGPGASAAAQPEQKRRLAKLQQQYEQQAASGTQEGDASQTQGHAAGAQSCNPTTTHTHAHTDAHTHTQGQATRGGHDHDQHHHQPPHAHHQHHHPSPPPTAAPAAGAHTSGSHHARLHAGYHTVSCSLEQPASMAGFQAFVALLAKTQGLYRAKGILWFREDRLQRYTFHLSGRQRVECVQEGAWDAPSRVQLVLIGSDPAVLDSLRASFLQLAMAPGASDAAVAAVAQVAPQHVAAAVRVLLAQVHERLEVAQEGGGWSGSGVQGAQVSAGDQQSGTSSHAAAGAAPAAGAPAGAGTGAAPGTVPRSAAIVEFRVKGDALHGVLGSEVCASIMRRVNAGVGAHGVLVFGVSEPPGISAAVGGATHGTSERMRSLQLAVPTSLPVHVHQAEGAGAFAAHPAGHVDDDVGGVGVEGAAADVARQVVAVVAQPVAAVMRHAFPHTGCRCDVVAGMRAQ